MRGSGGSELYAVAAELRRAAGLTRGRASIVVRKSLHDIEADGKATALSKGVIDTGALINSISVDIDSDRLGGRVGPTVDYAIYQELGTSTQPGRPFMGPAFDRQLGPFVSALAQSFKL
jgi:HK97 gp10 family phage protein